MFLTKPKSNTTESSLARFTDEVKNGALIGFEGKLNLGGLVELSDSMHDAIPQFKCSVLVLASLSILSDEDAKSLSKFQGIAISLQGLSEISDSAVQIWSQCTPFSNSYYVGPKIYK
jgi:hypothetical protein